MACPRFSASERESLPATPRDPWSSTELTAAEALTQASDRKITLRWQPGAGRISDDQSSGCGHLSLWIWGRWLALSGRSYTLALTAAVLSFSVSSLSDLGHLLDVHDLTQTVELCQSSGPPANKWRQSKLVFVEQTTQMRKWLLATCQDVIVYVQFINVNVNVKIISYCASYRVTEGALQTAGLQ